jgi:hypothetical protein
MNQILKIGIFVLIAIGSFLVFPKIGHGCVIYDKACGCYTPDVEFFGCGYAASGLGWVCGIEMTPTTYNYNCQEPGADPKFCRPEGYENVYPAECKTEESWFRELGCPNTDLYNGKKCDFVDGCYVPYNIDHCEVKTGNWNAADKACVQCIGKKRAKLLANTSKKCFNAKDDDCTIWEELDCANEFAGKCDYGCGADLKCNHKGVGDPCGTGGTCDSNCQCSGESGPPPPPPGACPTGPTYYTCQNIGINCATCPEELIGGLVPCGRMCDDPCTIECECAPCTLCHLFVLAKRVIDFLTLNVLFPLAVLVIVIGGIMFLTAAGNPGRIETSKKILTSVVIGLLIIFLAWLIVDTIIMFMTKSGSPFQNWKTINCPVP